MRIADGSRLLFIGDSVTDCGRQLPVGAGPRPALGHGYVGDVHDALAAVSRNRPIEVVNMGVSGNTVRDLAARWDSDVLAQRPDWISVLIGTNDVWRQFDGKNPPAAVMPGEFRRVYGELIRRTRPAVAGIVLLTPFYAQDDPSDPMRRRMDEYGAIVMELAAEHRAAGVDLQAEVDAAMEWGGYASIAGDRVHPTAEGHQLIARAFLGAVSG